MIFCTPWFLQFSVVMAALYLLVRPWRDARLVAMLAASVYFYFHFAGLAALCVMLGLATFTYCAGLGIDAYKIRAGKRSRWLLGACVLPAIAALLYFRYYEFLTESLRTGFASLGWAVSAEMDGTLKGLAPFIHPLGISFFAFEFCHYLVDIYRKDKPLKNPLHFGLFALFYPRLASGPIVRFQQIVPQFITLRRVTRSDVQYGVLRIASGFAKKFILADPAANLIATAFQVNHILAPVDIWWLILLLYIRIYMDFSGYCDMAVGLARLWGIRLPENFHFPFLATSPSTFWKRWHITLSTWIRDYIYIPLGGGRVPAWKKSFNLLFAMGLCGLWHGSAWNFVAWGAAHGLALQVGHGMAKLCGYVAQTGPKNPAIRRTAHYATKSLGWVSTQLFVAFTWILFFYPRDEMWQILARLRS